MRKRNNCQLTTKFRVFVAIVATVVPAVTEVVYTDATIARKTLPVTIRASFVSCIQQLIPIYNTVILIHRKRKKMEPDKFFS